MVLRIITEWKNGQRHQAATNTTAQTGRYLLASMRTQDGAHFPLREVKNGYQYDTPHQYCGSSGAATTTVTLERGWK